MSMMFISVTWGLNPFNSFQSIPRTRSEAQSDGWVSFSPGTGCDGKFEFCKDM